jgi:TatD DNase family protein
MTDAHCHVSCGDESVREFIAGRDFFGLHPWETGKRDEKSFIAELRAGLLADPSAGVGEIGLDRLREKNISLEMRSLFEAQLTLAVELGRPVVLHGAKCWGQVVAAVKRAVASILCEGSRALPPTFLFHGFSRSDGLIPDIVALNGYISVGPAVLNDHAVNYRELVKKIPRDRLLIETDRTQESAEKCPHISEVLEALARVRGETPEVIEAVTDENAANFWHPFKCSIIS